MHEENELTEVKVFRYDPSIDEEPRYEVYPVPYKGRTVLQVLRYIYEHHDPSLSFRNGCAGKGSSRCGACPVNVNGVAALSCQTTALKGMTVEPHPKFELVKDLVVDFSRIKDERPKGPVTLEIKVDEQKCVGCGDCIHICPVGVHILRRIAGKNKADPADIGSCCGITCQMCVNNCSRGAIAIRPLG